MRVRSVAVTFLGVVAFASLLAGNVPDGELTSRLERMLRYDHDYRHELESILASSGFDSNRLVNVARTLYSEDLPSRERARLAVVIAKYAKLSDLPYLEGLVTNSVAGFPSLSGILRLEGMTSNSLAQVGRFLQIADTNKVAMTLSHQKGFALVSLFQEPAWSAASDENKQTALNYAYSYVSNNVNQIRLIDGVMRRANPEYGYSKKRLSLLRLAATRDIPEITMQFVTNAINELVSYPEENLPE